MRCTLQVSADVLVDYATSIKAKVLFMRTLTLTLDWPQWRVATRNGGRYPCVALGLHLHGKGRPNDTSF